MKRHRKSGHQRRMVPRSTRNRRVPMKRWASVHARENCGYDAYDRVAFGYDVGQGGADVVSPALTPEATDHTYA